MFILAQQYMLVVNGLVNFQSWQGIIKYGSEAIVSQDDKRLAAIFKFGVVIDLISAVAGMVIAIILVPLVGKMLMWSDQLIVLSLVFSIEIIFRIEGTPKGVLRLLNKFHLTAKHSILVSAFRLLVICTLYIIGDVTLHQFVMIYVFI